MCGIVGYLSKTNEPVKAGATFVPALEKLIVAVESRGRDACGYVASTSVKTYWDKHSFAPTQFVRRGGKRLASIAEKANSFVFHSRFGTGGSAHYPINNHPHVSKDGRFLLVHNGIIPVTTGKGPVYKTVKKKLQGGCDTEYLLRFIELKGDALLNETLSTFVSEMGGSYAIVLYDTKLNKIYFYRNYNPLYVVEYKNFLLYASTLEIAQAFYNTYAEKQVTNYYSLDPDKVLGYDLSNRNFSFEGVVAKDPTETWWDAY